MRQSVPEDIILKSLSVFRCEDRRFDPAAWQSLGKFLVFVEDGKLSFSRARDILADDVTVSAFIEETRKRLEQGYIEDRTKAIGIQKSLIKAITDSYEAKNNIVLENLSISKETLTNQNAMRDEMRSLFEKTQKHVESLENIVTGLHAVVADIKGIVKSVKEGVEKVTQHAIKAVKNTSWKAAVVTATFLAPITITYSIVANKLTDHIGGEDGSSPEVVREVLARDERVASTVNLENDQLLKEEAPTSATLLFQRSRAELTRNTLTVLPSRSHANVAQRFVFPRNNL